MNTVATISDGFPLSVASVSNPNVPLGHGTWRPISTGVAPKAALLFVQKIDGWFHSGAFAPPGRFESGDLPRAVPLGLRFLW